MKYWTIVTPDDVTPDQLADALEVGAEEADLHADRDPGIGIGRCGDKICTVASHAVMMERAHLLDDLAAQIREEYP